MGKSGMDDLQQPRAGHVSHHLNTLENEKQYGIGKVTTSTNGTLSCYPVKQEILCTTVVLQHFHHLELQQQLVVQ